MKRCSHFAGVLAAFAACGQGTIVLIRSRRRKDSTFSGGNGAALIGVSALDQATAWAVGEWVGHRFRWPGR
jgi:hypothetical protein